MCVYVGGKYVSDWYGCVAYISEWGREQFLSKIMENSETVYEPYERYVKPHEESKCSYGIISKSPYIPCVYMDNEKSKQEVTRTAGECACDHVCGAYMWAKVIRWQFNWRTDESLDGCLWCPYRSLRYTQNTRRWENATKDATEYFACVSATLIVMHKCIGKIPLA